MKTLPSPPLLLPLSTFLLVAFLFTATALPSLLLFGYREVIIGVVIDKLIKFASFLRTLRSKESTVSYFQVGTALLGCREPYSALAGLWQAQTFTKSHGRGEWPGPNFMGGPTISDLANIINYLRTQHKANTSSIKNAFNPFSPQMQKSIGCSPSGSRGWLGAVGLCSHPTSQQNFMPNISTWQKTKIQSTALPNAHIYTMWSQRSVSQPVMKAGPPGLVSSAAELQSTCVSWPVTHSTTCTKKAGPLPTLDTAIPCW